PTQTSVAGGTNITFSLGSINANGTTNITVIAKLGTNQCSDITNKAFVTSAVADPDSSNNSKTVTRIVLDSIPPMITCASVPAQSANAGPDCSATVPDVRLLVRAQSSDNCTALNSLTITQDPAQGSTV